MINKKRSGKKFPAAVFLLTALITLLCGCSQIRGKLLVMQANYQNARGMYAAAISSYLSALNYVEAAPYAEYGLGSVYYTMGEEKAAIDRYAEAAGLLEGQPAASRELLFRIHYNTGVVLFGEGDFAAAADSFREALRTDGRKIEAKRNLELSLQALERKKPSGGGPGGESESQTVLFEYVRQKELEQWTSREWPEEENTGPDY